ncbi:MAG: hypothetical protein M9887_11070 [Chitinophagales bacterium]|nr:hypothetical protein [Chitinophagales bacterium]
MLEIINQCRCCESDELVLVHDFGKVPIADVLTDTKTVLEVYLLSAVFCKNCYHFQIRENISPKILFQNNYPYYSSKIPEVVQHFEETYQAISQYLAIDNQDTIIEIAANDGVLISQFKTQTKHLISIEPSTPHAEITEKLGITTYNRFFNKKTAGIVKKIFYKPQS